MTDPNEQSEPSETPERKPLRLPRLPRPGRPAMERRKLRSKSAASALELALAGAARRGNLDALLITDAFGLLVSQSSASVDLSELAAVTPIVAAGRVHARVRHAGHDKSLAVRSMKVLGETLYIAALADPGSPSERGVSQGCAAAARILAN